VKASPLNGTPNAISRLNPTQKKALKIIKDFGPIDGKTLAKELGIEYETLRSGVIKALKQHGVENPRNGTGYRLREPM
jgi:biotin operon repressor